MLNRVKDTILETKFKEKDITFIMYRSETTTCKTRQILKILKAPWPGDRKTLKRVVSVSFDTDTTVSKHLRALLQHFSSLGFHRLKAHVNSLPDTAPCFCC